MKTNLYVMVVVLSAAVVGHAGEPTEVQARAQKNIRNNAKQITALAYLRSTSFEDVKYVEGKAFDDGSFSLTYKFYYRDENRKAQNYSLRINYTKSGRVESVDTVSHTDYWPPFGSLALLGGIADAITKELDK